MSGHPRPGEPPSSHDPLLGTAAAKRIPSRVLLGLIAFLGLFAGALFAAGPAVADGEPPDDGTVAVAPTEEPPAEDPPAEPPAAEPAPAPAPQPTEPEPVAPAPAPTAAQAPPAAAPPTESAAAPTTDSGAPSIDEPVAEPAFVQLDGPLARLLSLNALDADPCDGCSNPYTPVLEIEKTHDPLPSEPIDSDPGQRITYRVVVSNVGQATALDVVVTDQLPDGLLFDEESVVAPDGWTAEFPGGGLVVITAPGPMAAGTQVEISFDAVVGELPRDGIGSLLDDLVNVACVEATQSPKICDDDDIPVKSIALQADALCLNNTPYVDYAVTPKNVGTPPPPVAMIWWTAEAYANRDPGIDAADFAALLADGASQVDYVSVPPGWADGETISGQQLWPGAAVDALGNPTDWPGWTELADGTWILDPAAPFYDLRLTSVIEFRINPTISTSVSYPPAEEGCYPTNPNVDLHVEKTHGELDGDAVDSGDDDVITYTIVITNNGTAPATGVGFVDTLPEGLVVAPDSISAPGDWSFTITPTGLEGSTDDPLEPGESVTITFGAIVGELPRAGTDVVIGDLVNNVCVDAVEPDMNPDDDCDTDEVGTRSIALSAAAQCLNDTPYINFAITPTNVTASPTVAMIWWTPAAYAARNPDIDAADEAALLADGALEVTYLVLPADWSSGDPITGQMLWPGAAVDADGNPTDWPGWNQLPDGTWFLDPTDPFFALRSTSIVEFRINPTVATTVNYPPPTVNCLAMPPFPFDVTGFAAGPGTLALTGAAAAAAVPIGALLIALGTVMLRGRRRGA